MIPQAPQGRSEETTFSVRHGRKKSHYVVKAMPQEVRMWQAFGDLVRGGDGRKFWMRVALATQLCVDALLESARSGGAAVRVDPNNVLSAYKIA